LIRRPTSSFIKRKYVRSFLEWTGASRGAEPLFEDQPVIFDRHCQLSHDAKAAPREVLRKNDLVDRFEQPGPQIPMNHDRRIDDAPSDVIKLHATNSPRTPRLRVRTSTRRRNPLHAMNTVM
jgi:hypothetical protein